MIITHANESWIALSVGILFGVLGTMSMKLSHGFTRIRFVIFLALFYFIAFIALTFAMKNIELSTVYAVWSGVGTVLMTAIGVLYFHEEMSFRRSTYLLLIILGVIGIHLNDLI